MVCIFRVAVSPPPFTHMISYWSPWPVVYPLNGKADSALWVTFEAIGCRMTIRTSFLLDVIFVFRRSWSVRSLEWMDLMSVGFSSQFMYWPDAHFLYLVNFNYCPLSGHSDRGSWPLSGVGVNYELPHGTRIYCLWTRFSRLVSQVCAVASHPVNFAITLLDSWRARRELLVMYL